MLSAIAGGEALEILVVLKDLSGTGFKKLQTELAATEKAAGKTAKGAGAAGGAVSALGGPLMVAAAGFAAVASVGIAAVDTYQEVRKQSNLLDEALKAHGSSLAAIQPEMDAVIQQGVKYGQGADDVRAAITRLTQAGIDWKTIQEELPAVYDLANAKQMSAADSADLLAKATVGNVKALADLGIKLPTFTGGLAGEQKATDAVTKAEKELTAAQDALTKVTAAAPGPTDAVAVAQAKLSIAQERLHELQKKAHVSASALASANLAVQIATDNVTKAEAPHTAALDKIKAAQDKVATAEDNLKAKQDALTKTTDLGTSASNHFKAAADAVKGSTGDTAGSVDSLTAAQKGLSNKWEEFSTKIGPGLIAIFTGVIDALTTVLGLIGDILDKISKALDSERNANVQQGKGQRGFVAPARIGSGLGITHLAAGGIVEPRPGGTLALIGEGGEREYVIPQSKIGGLGGGSVTAHIHINLDGERLADVIGRIQGRRIALYGSSAG